MNSFPEDGTSEEKIKWVEDNHDSIIGIERVWNNSMYDYQDWIVVWLGNGRSQRLWMGIDFFDGYQITINKNSSVYKEMLDWQANLVLEDKKRRVADITENLIVNAGIDTDKAPAIACELISFNWQPKLIELLTKKLRSQFKLNLRKQAVDWFLTPKQNRKYNSPLSPRQMECLR